MRLLHLSISLEGQSSLRRRNYDKASLHTQRLRKKATAVEAGAEGVEEEAGGGTGRQMMGLGSVSFVSGSVSFVSVLAC